MALSPVKAAAIEVVPPRKFLARMPVEVVPFRAIAIAASALIRMLSVISACTSGADDRITPVANLPNAKLFLITSPVLAAVRMALLVPPAAVV